MPTSMRILRGPSHDPNNEKKEAMHASVLNIHIPYQFERDTLADIHARGPQGWEPELVIWTSPEYNTPPLGIENSPYPTVAIVGDWNLGYPNIQQNLRRFDWIVTDRMGVKIFQKLGYSNVDYWPMFFHKPEIHRRIDKIERTDDIVFIGNLNHEVQQQRAKLLFRISQLSDRYRVRILTNVYGEEYGRAFNRAKIVFNHSIRGEMNMRAFEAPACGALLFMEEENLEIMDFLKPGLECVIYNKDNLEELLEYYLTRDKERERIAEAGSRRINKLNNQLRHERLYRLLEDRGVLNGKTRCRSFNCLPKSRRIYQDALLAIQNHHYALAENKLKYVLVKEPGNAQAQNALGILYASAAMISEDAREKDRFYNKAENVFTCFLEKAPEMPMIHYNLGYLAKWRRNLRLAKASLLQAREYLRCGKYSDLQDIFLPQGYNSFRVKWYRIAAEMADKHEKRRKILGNLLRYKCCSLLGDILKHEKRFSEATNVP